MSLFWKIFGWFWVSQVLVVGAFIAYFTTSSTRVANPDPHSWPPFDGPRALIMIAVGALVSYFMARYLAAPAIQLRSAAHRLAEGDLTVRITPQMGRRRDELADMGRDFDMMAERIESLVAAERRLTESERRTVEAQQRLLADISHELRSPLARIAYALELAEGSADEETRNYLKRIERESERLNGLIGQLLTLARLEAAPENSNLYAANPIDLSKIVTDVCQDADFEARGVGRKVHLIATDACRVRGSSDLLCSAVENVVRNAVRHTPSGSSVEVGLHSDGNQVRITIRDFGPGVPEALLPELFRPFYRVESARERESGGVGLGLSIADRAVRFHGGFVDVLNAPDGGLLVCLVLPVLSEKTSQATTQATTDEV